MIFNKPLDSIFGQKTKINILRHLALYKKEAEDSIKHAERFLRWIKNHLPK